MNFNQRDELFVQIATNKANREKAIELLQKTRNFSFLPLLAGVFVSGTLAWIDVFSKRIDMAHILGFVTAMSFLMISMQLDSTIKMLKLAGALQEAQQARSISPISSSVTMTSSGTTL